MNLQEATFQYALRLGDTSLILAQRLSEWTGHGPFLEEDLALTNVALDIFGRAKALLEYAGQLEGKGRDEDQLAFFRHDREFRNALICEQINGDYAKTMVRQALIDAFDVLFYGELSKSKDQTLAGIAQKSLKEVTYHKRHSFSWVRRFGNGTEESMQRLKKGFEEIWAYTGELFEMSEVDQVLLAAQIGVDLKALQPFWEKEVRALLAEAQLSIPENVYMHTGGHKGLHTEHLGHLLAEMQAVPRMYPDAKW